MKIEDISHVEEATEHAHVSVIVQTDVEQATEKIMNGNFAIVIMANEDLNACEVMSVGTSNTQQMCNVIERMDELKEKFFEDFPFVRLLMGLHSLMPDELIEILSDDEEEEDGNIEL